MRPQTLLTFLLTILMSSALTLVAGTAEAKRRQHPICDVIDTEFSLEELVAKALDNTPGDAIKSRLRSEPAGRVIARVKILQGDGTLVPLFLDARTGEFVEPTEPTIPMDEAMSLALAAVENGSKRGKHDPVVLSGRRASDVTAPSYVITILHSRPGLLIVTVDGITGETQVKSNKKQKRGRKHGRVKCKDADSDSDSDSDTDGDGV